MTDLSTLEALIRAATATPWSHAPAAVVIGADGKRVCSLRGRLDATDAEDGMLIVAAVNNLEALISRVRSAEALVDRLRLEAQMHSGEARAHRSTVHEAYQAVTGATGEPGNWHGAEPVREMAARVKVLEDGLRRIIDLDHHNMGAPSASSVIARTALKGAENG